MFEVPSTDEVARVVITRESVESNEAPTIVPARASRREEKSA
jgi:ATP-dependent Clp protease ATP-binding subunit ClpX